MEAVVFFYIAFIVLIIAGIWKVFTKAGQPGWAAIIPIYNVYVMTQVGGLEIIWFILTFIPIANIIAAAKINIAIAEKFGKSVGFGIGLWLLGPIFYPILGFGSAQYVGAAAGAVPPPPPAAPPAPPAGEMPPDQPAQ